MFFFYLSIEQKFFSKIFHTSFIPIHLSNTLRRPYNNPCVFAPTAQKSNARREAAGGK
jgi:hypothetical protein